MQSADRMRKCDCPTTVLFREDSGKIEHTVKLDPFRCRVEGMRAHVDEGGRLSHENAVELLGWIERELEQRAHG